MLKKVKDACLQFGLTKGVKHVTVALSGGADSMALLCAILELKDELGIQTVDAVHFNHKIRGDEALRDLNFVRDFCEKSGVKLHIGEADVPKYALENSISTELAARELRYRFFDTIDTDAVATAHTASDNIETVIFNITRGTALSGLCGIPPNRERYIRPLILCTRQDVETYCRENGISYVTDSTNLCDEYTRNKIRHNVIPVLKGVNASVEIACSRMSASVREDEDFINSVVNEKYNRFYSSGELDVSSFNNLHSAVAKRLIKRFCSDLDVDVDAFHINEIFNICINGGKTSISKNRYALVKNGILKITDAENSNVNIEYNVKIDDISDNLFKNCKNVYNLLLKNILDCDKIVGELTVRHRIAGDKIRLKNKNCTKTLKKLFCEYKIPVEERDLWPVISDDLGLVWVYKIGVADRCAADANSVRVCKINVEKIYKG